jgi:ribosomal protein S18 acetylase RimI-like enzyme
VDDVHNRLRGFYTDSVVETPAQVDAFAASFDAARVLVQTIEGVDRLSIRAVVHAGALATLEGRHIPVEAAVPLSAATPHLVVAYAAVNQPGREMSAEHLSRHRGALAQVVSQDQNARDHTGGLASRGFSLHTVHPDDAQKLAPEFLGLYQAFGYGIAEVENVLASGDNAIAYVQSGDRVVSTAMAERGAVTIGGLGEITLVEITEASTDPAFRGQGLYRAVSGHLAESLVKDPTINALYGESNLTMGGVLVAAHQNGRRFSHFDQYGLRSPGFGILQQNFHVADGAEKRPYNDFAVSYYPL